jgi:hypothetical protein
MPWSTRRYRVAVLTSLPRRVVMRSFDPTLPRCGTDFIATMTRDAIIREQSPSSVAAGAGNRATFSEIRSNFLTRVIGDAPA